MPYHCPSAHPTIRVLLVDDHRLTLWGLERLIESAHPRMTVVGTACSRRELMAHQAIAQADVILLDLDLGEGSGAEAMPDLMRECQARVLVLTGDGDREHHRQAVMQGARGIVHKSQPADVILNAIEKVHSGEIWLERSLVASVLGHLVGDNRPARDDHAERIARLTPKERDIVRAVVRHRGAKNFVVADELHISEHTLRNHLTTIYDKLAVHGRLELYLYATEHGLMH
jgi:DNA-binding NarL/FixJ family response regulator